MEDEDMKICPVCQTGSGDETVVCRECGVSLGAVAAQDEEVVLKAEMDRYERRQRRLKNLAMAGVILSAVLNLSFFVISIIRNTFFFPILLLLPMPAAGYLMIFKAEALFRFEIDVSGNYDIKGEISPTDWYLLKNAILGVGVMLISTILSGIVALH